MLDLHKPGLTVLRNIEIDSAIFKIGSLVLRNRVTLQSVELRCHVGHFVRHNCQQALGGRYLGQAALTEQTFARRQPEKTSEEWHEKSRGQHIQDNIGSS